ncbi:MAG: hypothetical protein VB817_08555, partial [Pirellulaceae bacterium]
GAEPSLHRPQFALKLKWLLLEPRLNQFFSKRMFSKKNLEFRVGILYLPVQLLQVFSREYVIIS